MASIHLTEVTKTYGDEPAVDGLTFSVDHGEFLVLLGPSGCGKSTILRMLAGLVDVTAGEIAIDGHRVDQLTPKDRDLAFVFQNYALYPNLTVRKNIAFPLVMASMRWWQHLPGIGWWWRRRAERTPGIRDLVERTAATLELTPLLDRRPRTLSGGQRQRVALGRAMVRDPAAFLMDEPLSNLDAKLRTRTRAELVMLHERLGATFVYVTHDQVEAMTMGTVIAVLRDGRLQQFGTPKEIFQRPSNVFVARFIGSPPMNILPCHIADGRVVVDGVEVAAPAALADAGGRHSGDLLLGVRPEAVTLVATAEEAEAGVLGRIDVIEHVGQETLVGVRVGLGHEDPDGTDAPRDAVGSLVYARLPGYAEVQRQARVRLEFDLAAASLFDAESERRLPWPPAAA